MPLLERVSAHEVDMSVALTSEKNTLLLALAARNHELLLFRDAALHLAFRACGNRADAEDILQEAYLRAVAATTPVLSGNPLRNWFFQITANAARDHFRTESRRRLREKDASMKQTHQTDVAAAAEASEIKASVETELNRLDERYRLPISLHYEHGLSYDEVAEVLGMSSGTLRVYASKGIQELRERLDVPNRPVSAEILIGLLGANIFLHASPALASSVEAIIAKGSVAQPAASIAAAKPFFVVANTGKSSLWMALGIAAAASVLLLSILFWRLAEKVPTGVLTDTKPDATRAVAGKPFNSNSGSLDTSFIPADSTGAPKPVDPNTLVDTTTRRELNPALEKPEEILGFANPASDRVTGDWKRNGSDLICAPGSFARIAIPYHPPEEYDLKIEFTRSQGNTDVNIIFPANGKSCLWKMDSWSSCYFGIHSGNPDLGPKRPALANNVRHTALIEVRRDTLSAYVNGVLYRKIEIAKALHLCSIDYRIPDHSVIGLASWRCEVTFHSAAIRAVTGRGARLPTDVDAANSQSDTYWRDALDLMPTTVERGNALVTKWQADNGALSTPAAKFSRYQLNYAPPEEYDFRIDFTRHTGNSDIAQILSVGGRQFMWKIDISSVCCFDVVNGAGRDSNPTSLIAPGFVTNGVRHTSVVCVRKSGVKAYIDGRLACSFPTSYENVSIEQSWSLPGKDAVGVGFHNCAGTFHRIQIKPITGTGRTLPPNPLPAINDPF